MWLPWAAVLLLLCAPFPAHAHSAPIPIALWGGFSADLADCQRVIARSAATCASTAWSLSDACLRAQLDGGDCDTAAADAAIEQAHVNALAAAGNACRSVDFVALGYNTLVDINIDIDVFCQDLQNALVSAVYGPALRYGEIQPIDETTRACIAATSDVAERLLQTAFRIRRRAFDRIASARFTPSRKFALLQHSAMRIQRAQQVVQARLSTRCPTFSAIYPRAVAPYLTLIAERADCLSGRTYVQDFVVCPDSICGNGMREPGERCDDGNAVGGDSCRADCQGETP